MKTVTVVFWSQIVSVPKKKNVASINLEMVEIPMYNYGNFSFFGGGHYKVQLWFGFGTQVII